MLDPNYFQQSFAHISPPLQTDCMVYLKTNETGADRTIEKIKSLEIIGNAIMGVSGLFTLDLVAARKNSLVGRIDYLIMCDISKKVESFWNDFNDVMLASINKEHFLKNFTSLLSEKLFYLEGYRQDDIPWSVNYILNGSEWFKDNDSFNFVHQIFLTRRFAFIPLDLSDSNSCHLVAKALKTNNIFIDVFYASNVFEVLPLDKLGGYQEGIKHICHARTQFIDTHERAFKLTDLTSGRFKSLLAATCYPSILQLESLSYPTQQVIAYGEKPYPLEILDVKNQLQEKEQEFLLYVYGLQKGYYSVAIADSISDILEENNYTGDQILTAQYHLFCHNI